MTGSYLLFLRLSRDVFRSEGAVPSNQPEGQEDTPAEISHENSPKWTSHVERVLESIVQTIIQVNQQLIDTWLHDKKQSFVSSIIVIKNSRRNARWATYVDPPGVSANYFRFDWMKILLYSPAGLISWHMISPVEMLVLLAFS